MKQFFLLVLAMGIGMSASAQQITVAEPEFVSCYFLLTSDSTYIELPKETGSVKKHQSKVSKWAKLTSGVSSVVSAGGLVGAYASNSASGIVNGVRTFATAASVGNAASTVSTLASVSGEDIIFQGKSSTCTITQPTGDLQFIVKAENNETNPADLYRIVQLKTSKKDRRVQWYEYDYSLLGSQDAAENGYINFTGNKYGEQSYLLTIPAEYLSEGQYGIFYQCIESAESIPVATFGIE